MSLANKTISGLFWTFSQQLSVKLINFVVQVILARILLPTDFGLIAMIMVFISIGASLADSGLTSSLIRTVDADQRDYSTVFIINMVGSVIVYFIVFTLAPYIASFYEAPILTKIIRVFSISFIIRGFVGVQTTILRKELKFKKEMYMQIPSVVLGGVVGVVMALYDYGVWSLVWLNLVQSSLFALQHWFRSDWYPNFTLDIVRLKTHFNFGYKLTLASLLNAILANIYNLVIGKWFSPIQLGYYNRADTIQMFPLRTIITAFKSVAYPVLSSIKEDDKRLKLGYKKMMLQVVFWITPLMTILIIVAKPLFILLLTEKWLPAVPYFQILCVSSLLYPLQEYNLQILDVKGRSDLYLKIESMKKTIVVLSILCSISFGIYGLLISQVFLSIIFYYISSHFSGKLIDYRMKEQIQDTYKTFVLALSVGAICYLISLFLEKGGLSDFLQVIIILVTYISVYITISYKVQFPAVVDIIYVYEHQFKSKFSFNNKL